GFTRFVVFRLMLARAYRSNGSPLAAFPFPLPFFRLSRGGGYRFRFSFRREIDPANDFRSAQALRRGADYFPFTGIFFFLRRIGCGFGIRGLFGRNGLFRRRGFRLGLLGCGFGVRLQGVGFGRCLFRGDRLLHFGRRLYGGLFGLRFSGFGLFGLFRFLCRAGLFTQAIEIYLTHYFGTAGPSRRFRSRNFFLLRFLFFGGRSFLLL